MKTLIEAIALGAASPVQLVGQSDLGSPRFQSWFASFFGSEGDIRALADQFTAQGTSASVTERPGGWLLVVSPKQSTRN